MSNDTLREELDRLDKAATPGKLYAIGRYLSTRPSITHSPDHIDELGEDRDSGRFQAVPFHRAEDAELLASLRNAVPQILEALATNRAQAEEIEKLKEERDARAKEAAQAQARVKEVEKALRHAISVYGLMTQAMEDGPHDKEFAQWQAAIAESSPTAALEAVVQRAREEERGKVRALIGMDETAWLVERNTTPDGQEYLFVDPVGALGWTTDNLKALRLSRKADAESLVAIVEDAVRVAEHAWVNHSRIKEES